MTDEPGDLGVALDDLHADKKKVLKAQLRSIEEEIIERRLIASDTSLQVHDEVGELDNTIPSRLAREIREYGESIIAATQQTDVSDSLIANSGIKLILRCDFPRDVDVASRLLQIDPKWLPKLALGTGIARLPTRYYTPFLFTFPEQSIKNQPVTDDQVQHRHDALLGRPAPAPAAPKEPACSERELALLGDIALHPIAGITARYERLGWNVKVGNSIKNAVLEKGLALFESVPTATARIKILTLTDQGITILAQAGVAIPRGQRGGAAHEYWRATIRTMLEQQGYTTTTEAPTVDGGAVDLEGSNGDHHVIVEVETGKSDIAGNIAKCAGFSGTLVFFFVTPELRAAWQEKLPAGALALTAADLEVLRSTLR